VTQLLGVELRRAYARRQVRVLLVLALAGIVIGGIVTLVNTDSLDQSRTNAAQARAEFMDFCVPEAVQFRGLERDEAQEVCEEEAQFYVFENVGFVLTDLWEPEQDDGVLAAGILVLVFGAVIAAASFTGAEWKHGTIGTQLVWEPRRGRVLAAKLAVAAGVTFVVGFVLLALFCLALWPTALVKTTTDGADAEWFADLVAAMLRGSALAALAALVAASIAMIGRNTTAAIGAAFVYMLIIETAVRAWFGGSQRWLIAENSGAFLLGEQVVGNGVRGGGIAAITLLGYAGLLCAAAFVTFRVRDVAGSS
jgi:ABC-2 type transport system permease protein